MSGDGGKDYLGIVIQQSLKDNDFTPPGRVVARKRVKTWVFLLVSVAPAEFDKHVLALRNSMVTDDTWYAHYFRDRELVIVFREAVFKVGIDPATWAPAIAYGLEKGVPLEQLDFHPRTAEDAARFFSTSLPPAGQAGPE